MVWLPFPVNIAMKVLRQVLYFDVLKETYVIVEGKCAYQNLSYCQSSEKQI